MRLKVTDINIAGQSALKVSVPVDATADEVNEIVRSAVFGHDDFDYNYSLLTTEGAYKGRVDNWSDILYTTDRARKTLTIEVYWQPTILLGNDSFLFGEYDDVELDHLVFEGLSGCLEIEYDYVPKGKKADQ